MTVDFGALLTSSSNVLSSARTATGGGTSTLKRSLRRLSAASDRLGASVGGGGGGGGGGDFDRRYETDAAVLLAREGDGFDAARLGRSARRLDAVGRASTPRTPYGARSGLLRVDDDEDDDARMVEATTDDDEDDDDDLGDENESLERWLRRRHDRALSAVATEQRRATFRAAEVIARERAARDHEAAKVALSRDLAGYRALRGSDGRGDVFAVDDDVATGAEDAVPLLGASSAVAYHGAGASTAAAFGGGSRLSGSARRDAAVVAALNVREAGRRPNDDADDDVVARLTEDLSDSAAAARRDGGPDPARAAWTNALRLARDLAATARTSDDPARDRAVGVMAHSTRQYRAHVLDRARSAALSGRSDRGATDGGLAGDVAAFVEIELGDGAASDATWPRLFYCLRCGDGRAALETMETAIAGASVPLVSEYTALVPLVKALADGQSRDATSFWESPSPTLLGPRARQDAVDLYRRAKASPDGGSNPFRVAVLALLSLEDDLNDVSAARGVVTTVEDYLFAALWRILFRASERPVADGVAALGATVRRWGRAHFEAADGDGPRGWGYAAPLLATQQFAAAAVHLARSDRLSRATHLAIALDAAGVALKDVTAEKDPDADDGARHLLASLLVSYAATVRTVDPEAALEYLVRVPDADGRRKGREARKHIARLVLETRAFALLAGSLATNGASSSSSRRGSGALDAHFSPREVSRVLVLASETASREGNPRDAAELLALAGHYGDLVGLLNREMGSRLVVADGDETRWEERAFWKDVCFQFYNAFLTGGRTHVQEVLEAENRMHLLTTFHLLMNLVEFFDRCKTQNWEEAWNILCQLNVLPLSDDDVSFRAQSYDALDDSVKRSFHHVLLGAMESLYKQYATQKAVPDGDGCARQRRVELKTTARALVTFASVVRMSDSGDVHARIARMEVLMM